MGNFQRKGKKKRYEVTRLKGEDAKEEGQGTIHPGKVWGAGPVCGEDWQGGRKKRKIYFFQLRVG